MVFKCRSIAHIQSHSERNGRHLYSDRNSVEMNFLSFLPMICLFISRKLLISIKSFWQRLIICVHERFLNSFNFTHFLISHFLVKTKTNIAFYRSKANVTLIWKYWVGGQTFGLGRFQDNENSSSRCAETVWLFFPLRDKIRMSSGISRVEFSTNLNYII